MKINVITNYNGWFNSSIALYKKNVLSMNVDKLKQFANEAGMELNFMTYPEIDATKDCSGQYFIYTSSEDPGLNYKGYMEDVLYGIKLKGGILIPEWKYMRAHHNKVMMEKLRDIELEGIDTGIRSKYYGCNEEFNKEIDELTFPCVFKAAEGAGSKGVALLRDKESAKEFLDKVNCTHQYTLKEKLYLKIGRMRPALYSRFCNKFVIQNFVPNLGGDFKVLVFGDKYYALSRANRDNDFRASGGGRLNYEPVLPNGIFDFAKSVFDALNVPVLSLDIAHDGYRFYLIEFQCLNFGTATLENSTHYFMQDNGTWIRKEEKSDLEKEFIFALCRYIQINYPYAI